MYLCRNELAGKNVINLRDYMMRQHIANRHPPKYQAFPALDDMARWQLAMLDVTINCVDTLVGYLKRARSLPNAHAKDIYDAWNYLPMCQLYALRGLIVGIRHIVAEK